MCEEKNCLLQEVMNAVIRTFVLLFIVFEEKIVIIISKTGGGDRYANLAFIMSPKISGNSVVVYLQICLHYDLHLFSTSNFTPQLVKSSSPVNNLSKCNLFLKMYYTPQVANE